MNNIHQATTKTVAIAFLLSCSHLYGEDSYYEINDEPLEQETFHASSYLDDKNAGYRLPQTNWQFGTAFLTYNTQYAGANLHDDQATGLRLLLGWESDTGYGVRARLSAVHNSTITSGTSTNSVTPPSISRSSVASTVGVSAGTLGIDDNLPSFTVNLQESKLDFASAISNIDLYKRIRAGRHRATFGAGFTAAGLASEAPYLVDERLFTRGASIFHETGYLLYGSEASELSLVTAGRFAVLTGEWKSQTPDRFTDTDANLTITEIALGFQWQRRIGWSTLELQVLSETQMWNTSATHDLDLTGGAFRAGLNW